jgi:HPt (histidine-containing phosphotransfer) domain-containing protein
MIKDTLKTTSLDEPRLAATLTVGMLDRAVIDQLYEDLDAETVDEILIMAAAYIERHGNQLLASIDAPPAEIKRAAHTLAGISSSIAAWELSALARHIEASGALDVDRDMLRNSIDRAVAELTAVVADRVGAGISPAVRQPAAPGQVLEDCLGLDPLGQRVAWPRRAIPAPVAARLRPDPQHLDPGAADAGRARCDRSSAITGN